MPTSIEKNTAFMTIGSIAQKVVSFAYFTMIARSIGPADTGKYFFTLSFTTLFVVFVDLGFTNVFVREAAKAKEKMQELFSTLLGAKLVCSVLTYGALILVINHWGVSEQVRALIYLSGVTMLFDSLHLSMYGVLRALGDLRYEAFSIPASQVFSLLLGSMFLFFHLPLLFLILAFTIPSVLNVCFVSTVIIRKYHILPRPQWDWVRFQWLIRLAWPFTLAAIFARLYSYADTILLAKIAGDTVVGWYSIAYKITFAFQFVPLALTAALYPKLSEYYASDRTKLPDAFLQAMKYVMLLSTPIAAGIVVLARPIVLGVYHTAYAPAILPLQLLIISLVFSFASFPIGAMLNACNRQTTQTTIVGITLFVNIILNLILAPRFGAVGAAISALIGNMMLALMGYMMIPPEATIVSRSMIKIIIQIGAAAGGMAVCTWYVSRYTHFAFAIIVGVPVYALLLFATRAFSREQMVSVLSQLRHRV